MKRIIGVYRSANVTRLGVLLAKYGVRRRLAFTGVAFGSWGIGIVHYAKEGP